MRRAALTSMSVAAPSCGVNDMKNQGHERQGSAVSFSWQGASGAWYEFDVARAKRAWEPVGGVYMFVKPGDYPTMEAGGPVALYIAAAESLERALSRNDMWGQAEQLGAAEIHLLVVHDDAERARVLADLVEAHVPLLNKPALRRVA